MSLTKRTFAASLWTFAANASQQGIQFVSFIVLARLLSPADFGTVALALAVIEILIILSRLGQIELLVRDVHTNDRLQQAFNVSLLAGGISTLSVFAFAPMLSAVTGLYIVLPLMVLLGPLCLLSGLTVVPEAILRQQMDFRAIARRTVIGSVVSTVIAVALAACGAGIWSLVAQRLVATLTQLLMLWRNVSWRPTLCSYWATLLSARPLIREGFPIISGHLTLAATARGLELIVGVFLGTTALGYLRLAWRLQEFLIQFAIQPIANVCSSVFSAAGNESSTLRPAFGRLTQATALIALPAFLGVAAIADHLFPVVFGSGWTEAIVIFQVMSLTATTTVLAVAYWQVMTAMRQTSWILMSGCAQLVVTVPLGALSAQYGLIAVVSIVAAISIVFGALNIRQTLRAIGYPPADLAALVWPGYVATASMAVATWLVSQWLDTAFPPPLELAFLVTFGAIVYTFTLLLIGRTMLRDAALALTPHIGAPLNRMIRILARSSS